MTTRPFKVLGIQQVAVGAADKNALRRLWVDTLGLHPHGNFKSEKENVDEDIVTMGAGPFTVEVDLMQPIDPDRKPRVDSPPLNHIGLWVDDIDAALAKIVRAGGKTLAGKTKISDEFGYYALFLDNVGNRLGLWSKS